MNFEIEYINYKMLKKKMPKRAHGDHIKILAPEEPELTKM